MCLHVNMHAYVVFPPSAMWQIRRGLIVCHSGNLWLGGGTLTHCAKSLFHLKEVFRRLSFLQVDLKKDQGPFYSNIKCMNQPKWTLISERIKFLFSRLFGLVQMWDLCTDYTTALTAHLHRFLIFYAVLTGCQDILIIKGIEYKLKRCACPNFSITRLDFLPPHSCCSSLTPVQSPSVKIRWSVWYI